MPTYLDWPAESTPSAEAEYDSYADAYHVGIGARSVDLDFYVREAAAALSPGGELLELGTGTGRVAERLIDAGYRVTGVDFSEKMLSRARARLETRRESFRAVRGDVRSLSLGRRFGLVIAPFGMMAHLLTEADRKAVMRGVLEHLEPGGVFVFDDMPTWLAGPSRGDKLEVVHEGPDPATGQRVRLMTTSIDVAGEPLTLSYHIIDWLDDERLSKRMVVRLVFRNTSLGDELAWLAEAGFSPVELLGGFDGRPFAEGSLRDNARLILRCRRPA